MIPSPQLVAALRQHQSGQFGPAETLYREAIAANPNDAHALHLFGVLLHQMSRNAEAADLIGRAIAADGSVPDFHYNRGLVLWALGRRDDAMGHWRQVLAFVPGHAPAHMNLGNALREQGRAAEAVSHLRRAVTLQPSPFAHNNLGLALSALGDAEASAHYRRAIEMHPSFIEPHLNLALEFAGAGHMQEAVAAVARSLAIQETPDNTALFARMVAGLDAVADDLRPLVTRAATEGWGRANELAPVATALVKAGARPGTDTPLLRWLLESAVVCDVDLERALIAMRAGLLAKAEAGADVSGDLLAFACALARQCYINEYVYAVTDDESERAAGLAPASPLALAVIASYRPLHALPDADALLATQWPTPLDAVLTQQIREPRAEAAARDSIPQLTPIEDGVSRTVRAMYEENPYPRWLSIAPPRRYESIDAYMSREYPRGPYARSGGGAPGILIAGCGTGRHSIETAQQFPGSRVLAVDLSTASLGYAKAKTEALGIANIEYAQADILKLGSLDRSFDMIQSAGVLHHLGDPFAGWRILLSRLHPGGVMYLGLYSETARRDVVAARAFIAEHGYAPTPEGIRACRQTLMMQPIGTPLRNVTAFNDFFTTSECRDLLFHPQEHRMTIPQISAFLDEAGLTFLGFEIDAHAAQRYAARFPADKAMTDLAAWHAFEHDNPYTFANMYRFWVQWVE